MRITARLGCRSSLLTVFAEDGSQPSLRWRPARLLRLGKSLSMSIQRADVCFGFAYSFVHSRYNDEEKNRGNVCRNGPTAQCISDESRRMSLAIRSLRGLCLPSDCVDGCLIRL